MIKKFNKYLGAFFEFEWATELQIFYICRVIRKSNMAAAIADIFSIEKIQNLDGTKDTWKYRQLYIPASGMQAKVRVFKRLLDIRKTLTYPVSEPLL